VQLHFDLAASPPACTLDSLDQGAKGIPCQATFTGAALAVEVPDVHGSYRGTLSADGNTVTGTWTQSHGALELVLARQAAAIEPAKAAHDPAMPPVDVERIGAVLGADLASVLAHGELEPATGGGLTIGVVQHGVRRVVSFGATKPDSLFEIGSVSKTFTGLLLAQMVEQKKARLDEPVRALLPAGTVAAPASGAEITLLDLSAQRSGLPRLPENFHPADPQDPYADYDTKALYAYVASHGVAAPAKPAFEYSNLGVGLLGQALAERAHATYDALLRREITGPLGMRDTVVTIPAALRGRFVEGHGEDHKPAHAWSFAALAGCGAIRSTAADMLTYVEAQLHPDHLPPASRATPEGRTLAKAIAASHLIEEDAGHGMHVALNWIHVDATGTYWHNGATGGHSTFVAFNPDGDFGVVVLYNASVGERMFADEVGTHVVQRLTGKPAVSLGPVAR
jgi:CubicO group peptidase (beta-lactamase class C family)